MSFTDEVKHELVRVRSREIPELAALIRMEGSIQIINKKLAVKIRLYLGDLARKIYSLVKEKFKLNMEIVVKKKRHFAQQQNIYELLLPPQQGLEEFLKHLGFLNKDYKLIFKIKEDFINNVEDRKAYLRGAFLGGGSINSPQSEYHLEFRCEHQGFAEDLIVLLASFGLNARLSKNHEKYVVYFKGAEEILTLLNIMGAHQALLAMENKRIIREVKNDVNRKVNCETANLDKTIQAALSQLRDIEYIEGKQGLDFLPPGLKEIALLRKKNPYASLTELGQLATPVISKSGVNHRMRRIRQIASRLRGDQ